MRTVEKAQSQAEATKEQDALQKAWRIVGETPEGKTIIRWLYKECGANSPILGATGGKLDPDATFYQAMRLNLWIKIRRMLNFNILKEVEYEPEQIS